MTRDLTDAEWLDIRTALLAASRAADVARLNAVGEGRDILDRARWRYLQLAEKLQRSYVEQHRRYPHSDDNCPGHVADMKVCVRCGTHIDELRPPEDDMP